MKNIFWEIFELMVTLFECGVSMHFVCKFLGLNLTETKNHRLWYGLVLSYAIAVTTMNMIMPYEGAFVIIYSLIVFIYALLFLPGTLIKKAVASVIFLCVIIMNSSLGVNLACAILNINASDIYAESDYLRLITVIFVQMLNLIIFHILEKTIGNEILKLRLREWLLLASTFFVSIFSMTLIQIAVTHINATKTLRLCFLGADLAIIIVNYITIQLISSLNHKYQTELENQQMKLQLQYQTQYAETVRQQEDSIHKLMHDFKATIASLYDFIHKKQFIEMKKYLETYADSLSKIASIVHTNQPFLNAILNAKLTYAKEQGIACTCHSPVNLPSIQGIDYCSLLGNMLDNSIEASIFSSIREIDVTIDYVDSKLIITIKNRIDKSILKDNPSLRTTKKKKSIHGHGISTIKEITKKYNGTTDFYENEGWFIASVMLYTE